MRRIILISLLAYSFLMIGLIMHNGAIIALVIPFVIILVAAFLNAPSKPNLIVSRQLSDLFISPGKLVSVKINIENHGKDIDHILVKDSIPPLLQLVDGHTHVLAALPAGKTLTLEYIVSGERGSYAFEKIHVRVMEVLSLFTRDLFYDAPGQFLIKPEVWRLRSIAIRPSRTHLYTGPIPSRKGGAGINFFEVREYAFGDPLRRINWKKSARQIEAMYTNQFEIERVTDVGIILDARQQTDITISKKNSKENQHVERSLFEYSVHATAALADLFLREGHRVGLIIYGRSQQATFPGYGKHQRERILRALAKARTGDNFALENLSYLPTRFFPPRSQVVLVSPLSPADPPVLTRLLAHGYHILVISPNPISFEAEIFNQVPNIEYAKRLANLERTLLLRRLRHLGVKVIDWQVDHSLERTIGASLRRAPRNQFMQRFE